MSEKRINYTKIINTNCEAKFAHWYEIENSHWLGVNPPDMTNAMNEILEIMKKNNILIVKMTKFNLKEQHKK